MKAGEKIGTDGGGSTLGALLLAGGMSFLAGTTDVYGLSRLRDLFVSFMSGDTTMLGQAISDGDMRRCGVILGIIGCFVAGAAAGTMLAERTGRRHPAAVNFLVAVLLAAGATGPAWEIALIVLAMVSKTFTRRLYEFEGLPAAKLSEINTGARALFGRLNRPG